MSLDPRWLYAAAATSGAMILLFFVALLEALGRGVYQAAYLSAIGLSADILGASLMGLGVLVSAQGALRNGSEAADARGDALKSVTFVTDRRDVLTPIVFTSVGVSKIADDPEEIGIRLELLYVKSGLCILLAGFAIQLVGEVPWKDLFFGIFH